MDMVMSENAAAARPNFFIVGAPKAGTTTMFRYLGEHPEAYIPTRKEPHYFAPDLTSERYVKDLDAYLELFEEGVGVPRRGEASVFYLLSEEAARRIHAFDPEARIIIMLRNPTDMVYSYHSQRVFNGREDIEDFEAALAAEPERRQGQRIPPNADPVEGLFYTEVGRYTEQVRRYLDVFDRHQVCIVVLDDLAKDPDREFTRVCEVLGIDPSFRPDSQVHNPNTTVRSRWLRDLLKFSASARHVARVLLPHTVRRWLGHTLASLNTKVEPRPKLAPATRRRLALEFADDIRQLSELIGRDLTNWTARDLAATEGVALSD